MKVIKNTVSIFGPFAKHSLCELALENKKIRELGTRDKDYCNHWDGHVGIYL
jgi:hypothetical protein